MALQCVGGKAVLIDPCATRMVAFANYCVGSVTAYKTLRTTTLGSMMAG